MDVLTPIIIGAQIGIAILVAALVIVLVGFALFWLGVFIVSLIQGISNSFKRRKE